MILLYEPAVTVVNPTPGDLCRAVEIAREKGERCVCRHDLATGVQDTEVPTTGVWTIERAEAFLGGYDVQPLR